jgi:copper(I)-binding protein
MIRFVAFFVLALAAASSAVTAHSHKKKGLEIVHPWTPATASGDAKTSPVYMIIKNGGRRPDRLLSARTPAAGKIELRVQDSGAANASSTASFEIPAGGLLELKRGGPHLAALGLKKRLDAYQGFRMTLEFERAGRVTIDVIVEEAADGHTH